MYLYTNVKETLLAPMGLPNFLFASHGMLESETKRDTRPR
jgi:hypothetical protein